MTSLSSTIRALVCAAAGLVAAASSSAVTITYYAFNNESNNGGDISDQLAAQFSYAPGTPGEATLVIYNGKEVVFNQFGEATGLTNSTSTSPGIIRGIYFFSPFTASVLSGAVYTSGLGFSSGTQAWGGQSGLTPVAGIVANGEGAVGVGVGSEIAFNFLGSTSAMTTITNASGVIPNDSIGLHVQSQGDDGEESDKYLIFRAGNDVSRTPDAASSLMLVAVGLAGMLLVRRRKA